MNEITHSPVFGVLLSLIAYEIGIYINKKMKFSIFNPLLIAIAIVIILLTKLNIKYESFNAGGQFISFFLYPATVSLALPMYKRFSLFQENALLILTSVLCGHISGMAFVILGSKFFGMSDVLTRSLIPKSITTPIGIAISKQLDGIQSVTVAAIIFTGIIGSILGPILYKFFKINDRVAFGIAIGASSHAIGTAKAMEFGEIEGAMSSLTMAISGIITVFLAPIIWNIFVVLFN
ncbi:LrgB family protein [Faecalispora anaeroviscerum]|uniref:LrgB family protein n=1 Tax=Faecalispora anaeroviscerum TaxID=2991836 RepID=UPI0024BA0884|nr:LrgB family protein [Faecalispora anaeroviscerum]